VAEQVQPTYPLLAIWRHPRLAMRKLIDQRSVLPAYVFAAASGIVNAFEFVQTSELDDRLANETVKLAVTVGAGIVSGVVFLFILSMLFMFFGRWLGGQGSYSQLNTAVGWAMLPFVGSLVIALIEYGLYGGAYLAGGELLAEAQAAHATVALILLLAKLVFAVYAIIFLVAGLTEAHRITLSQGAGTLLIFVILYVVFWIAVQAFSADI